MITRIPAFKAGTHRDSRGRTQSYSDADMANTARVYNAHSATLFKTPIVIGHPAQNSPTFGTIGKIEYADHSGQKFLDLLPDNVHPVFERMVQEKLFDQRSVSFWPPNHPSNPTKDFAEADRVWWPRHIGFVPIPAVKGLPPLEHGEAPLATVSYAEGDDEGVIEFSEKVRARVGADGVLEYADVPSSLAWAFRSLASLFTGLREKMIEKDGIDAADASLPKWPIADLERAAKDLETPPADAMPAPAYSDPPSGGDVSDKTVEFAERESALTAREQKIAAREKELARQEAVDFVEGLVKDADGKGRILPAEKAGLVEFLAGDGDVVEFSEGEGDAAKTVTVPRPEFLKGFLRRLPVVIDYGEHSGEHSGGDRGDPPAADTSAEAAAARGARAREYAEEQLGKGIVVTPAQAFAHIQAQDATTK